MLLGAVVLSGVNFEARAMENTDKALILGAGLATVTLGAWYLKNTGTYKTYEQHNARLAEEKEISDNPLLYAQPLQSRGLGQKEITGNEKLEAFLKQDAEKRNAYNQQTKKNEPYWGKSRQIDSYEQIKK